MVALWGSLTPAQAEPTLKRLSNFEWHLPQDWFGGFSGMEITNDGMALVLVSDRGRIFEATVQREGDVISNISLLSQRHLRHANGTLLKGRRRDVEGVAISPSGEVFLSFEFRHGISQVDVRTGLTQRMPSHPDFASFSVNKGLEALALHPDGRLFTLPERTGSPSVGHALYVLKNNKWRIGYRLPTQGSFRPVGADFSDDGHLYLLERTVSPLGFRTRIRRFNLDTGKVETLLSSLPGAYDNLEALSVWTDTDGKTRLILISDDNFLSLQTTQVVEFILTE